MPPKRASVLIVDDAIGDAQRLAADLKGEDVAGYPIVPSEINEARLDDADLVLVDFELLDWEDRDNVRSLALQPLNGLALAAVVRAHLDAGQSERPHAVALYTGQIAKIATAVPQEVRNHVVARLHNLEWIFEKGDSDAPRKIMNLVSAIQALPPVWPEDVEDAESSLCKLLGLSGDIAFRDAAWGEIRDCYPPIHELSEATHSLALVRWLAHRVLPYPTMLINSYHLAARLHVSPTTVERLLDEDGDIARAFDACRYRGILDGLVGVRWWRAGIDSLVWEWSAGTLDSDGIVGRITEKTAVEVERAADEPVVVVDLSYQPLALAGVAQAVRVTLDDWPPYADDAWARIRDCFADDRLAALVYPDDRRRIGLA